MPLALATVLFLFLGACTSTKYTKSSNESFVHPGLLHSKEELAFVRTKLATREAPWDPAWKQLRRSKDSSLNYKPTPKAHIVRGVRNKTDIGSSDFTSDSGAAYTHALQWALTGKEAHAQKAIEILNGGSVVIVEGRSYNGVVPGNCDRASEQVASGSVTGNHFEK